MKERTFSGRILATMYTTAVTLVLFLATKDLLVTGDPDINTFAAEDGKSYYNTPLQCSYPSLYQVRPYNNVRSSYTMTNDRNCCYLADSRNKCCVQTDSRGSYQGCKCDPSITCGGATTVPSTTASTTVPSTTASTTVPSTTTRTTVPSTTRTTPRTTTRTTARTTTRTTARTTTRTTLPSTTTTTTVPTTTTTTPVPTTTTTTTVPTTTTTTTVPTTTTATTVPTTTTRTTKPTTTKKTTKATTTKRPTTTTTRTTSTTVKTTTTTAPKTLCRSSNFRILNGDRAAVDCPNSGVFNITFLDGSTSSCNAVYTLATVNGNFKPTILTAEKCKNFIELLGSEDNAFEIYIGSNKYKILPPKFTLISGPSGTAFIELAQSESYLLDEVAACQQTTRCPYFKSTMENRVDFTKCKILSWGVSDAEDYSQNGLNEVALTINTGGCQGANTLCFKTASGKNLICSNDSGAPIYCKALETEELILMGVTGFRDDCDESSEVEVLPHPG